MLASQWLHVGSGTSRENRDEMERRDISCSSFLAGGFIHCLFASSPGKMIHFDLRIFVSTGLVQQSPPANPNLRLFHGNVTSQEKYGPPKVAFWKGNPKYFREIKVGEI